MKDLFAGIAISVFSVTFLVISSTIRDPGYDELGPRFLPQVILACMLVLSLVLAFSGYRQLRASNGAKFEAAGAWALGKPVAVMGLLALLTWALSTRVVAFEISGAIFMLCCGLVLIDLSRRGQILSLVAASIMMPAITGFVFRTHLFVNLP